MSHGFQRWACVFETWPGCTGSQCTGCNTFQEHIIKESYNKKCYRRHDIGQRKISKTCWETHLPISDTIWYCLCNEYTKSIHAFSKVVYLKVIQSILQYLKSTPVKGILFRREWQLSVEAYTDVDWARLVVDRRSTLGYYTIWEGNLVT